MRLIINDRRYKALKSLGEKKQCFNEYLQQRKKFEKEEERMKIKKSKEVRRAERKPFWCPFILDVFQAQVAHVRS